MVDLDLNYSDTIAGLGSVCVSDGDRCGADSIKCIQNNGESF